MCPFILPGNICSISELTLKLKTVGQCDVKRIMTIRKTITSMFHVKFWHALSQLFPSDPVVIRAIMSISTFTTTYILYLSSLCTQNLNCVKTNTYDVIYIYFTCRNTWRCVLCIIIFIILQLNLMLSDITCNCNRLYLVWFDRTNKSSNVPSWRPFCCL